ncbi:gamma-glutamylcyclotransferase [Comamonas flocculans]|uniref:glutathione-specific gamma-glutamylcyclotransferase n=1 Tax=Comamonas flocculans TaxID=2597701 RepID=A0A5B8RQ69_9BURK|nr:gamma-glutamylcyclotransferase [Comamonas flocculans]QEA11760.1 gamma-glutamylcyclotransferase [Comamonas flocculans]
MTATAPSFHDTCDGASDALAQRILQQWQARGEDLWVFGYGSLIWRPDLPYSEQRPAAVHGWHRALQMWSRVNRGTAEQPGLVFALLSGGSCRGVAFRVPRAQVPAVFPQLWQREMPLPVYEPRWLRCRTAGGQVQALGFTLSRAHPAWTGTLSDADYRRIFHSAQGRYGSTRDYAEQTLHELRRRGIRDRALERIVGIAGAGTITP